tara:strand:- start:689 stop:1288 length:600 start_codon:yes stop_codon:yes gene_type:complete
MVADQIDTIRDALANVGSVTSDFDLNRDVALPSDRVLRPAGVLAPIQEVNGRLELLLTKRSSALKHHPGQISFPGGKQDSGDVDSVAAALREAHEEIGLPPQQVEILGVLPIHNTVTSFAVTPVIGLIKGKFDLLAEPGEVEEVFSVPLAHVLDPQNYLIQSRRWRGTLRHYFVVPFGPYYIWGATARMLREWTNRMTS